jgi:hypothetical protein
MLTDSHITIERLGCVELEFCSLRSFSPGRLAPAAAMVALGHRGSTEVTEAVPAPEILGMKREERHI